MARCVGQYGGFGVRHLVFLLLASLQWAVAAPLVLRDGWTLQWSWYSPALAIGVSHVSLPHVWEKMGCGIYSTTVHFPEKQSHLALFVPAPLNASEVWINGQSMGGTGTATCTDGESVPSQRQRAYVLPADVDSVHIAILVSNYETGIGGLTEPPRIDTVSAIQDNLQFQRSLSYLFGGILFLMGLYHVVLFLYRPKSSGNIIFSLLSFVGVYRMLGSSYMLEELFPMVPWDVWERLDYATTGFFFALLYLFVHNAVPEKLHRKTGNVSIFFSLGYAAVSVGLPLDMLAPSLQYFLVLSLLTVFYILQAETRALWQMKGLSEAVLLVTTLLFIGTLINDILNAMQWIHTRALAPFGLMPLVVGRWLSLAKEYGGAYSLAETRLDEFMHAMAKAISSKSSYTGEHIERVTRISMRIADALGMPAAQQRQLHLGAVVHDLGKIHLPDDILDKPGELTHEELVKVQQHPLKGWEMLEKVEGLALPRLIIRHHHENWDGSGYPDGLAGKRIPLEARIVALADHWDAITSARAYRKAIPPEHARGLLLEEAGRKLDPFLVRLFLERRLWAEIE
jgi:HD-GYP domain-containing protein (c-di-GMP phosphodiesterase class II)